MYYCAVVEVFDGCGVGRDSCVSVMVVGCEEMDMGGSHVGKG